MRLVTVLLACALSAALCAQTAKKRKTAPAPAAASQSPWPIRALTVKGNRLYSSQQILAAAGLAVGDKVTPKDFEAARQRLLSTGAFQTAGFEFKEDPDGQGYRGEFAVTEETQAYPITFEDLPAPDAKLLDWLRKKDPLFGPTIPATQLALDRYCVLLEEYLKPLGFTGKVTSGLSADYSPDLTVLFRPNTPRPIVGEVHFTDTGEIPFQTLQAAIGGAAIGLGYSEARFRQILDASVRPVYEAHGYLHVSYPDIQLAPAKFVKGIAVTVKIDPGPVYKLSSFRIGGAPDLDGIVKLKTGQPVNFDQVKEGREHVEDVLKRRGFLHAKAEVQRTLDDKLHTVAVTIRADPGPQYTTGKLDIHGLDLLAEPQIRKLWGLAEGQPFNTSYPEHFLDVIRSEGLFDNLGATRAETEIHEDTHTVDIRLYFDGARKKQYDAIPGIPPSSPDQT